MKPVRLIFQTKESKSSLYGQGTAEAREARCRFFSGAWTARKAASLPSMPICTKGFIPSERPVLPAAPVLMNSIQP